MSRGDRINQLNETELSQKTSLKGSWHNDHTSNWIYVGNLTKTISNELLLTVLSQYGEIVHIERNMDSNYGFIKYSDQKSCILAIDNFNGIEVKKQEIFIDHSKDRTITNKFIFPTSQYSEETCDLLLSVATTYGGNCSPQLLAYKDFVDGKLPTNPLIKKRKKTGSKKLNKKGQT